MALVTSVNIMRTITMLLFAFILLSSVKGITNNAITRILDLEGPNSKQVTSIEFVNDGEADIETYTLLIDSNQLKNLVYIQAKVNNEKLEVKRSKSDDYHSSNHSSFLVEFKTPIAKGQEVKIIVLELYKNRKRPFPRTMKITEVPKIRVIDDAYYPSIYPTKKMKSIFELGGSSSLIKATDDGLGEIRGQSIRYGIFKDVPALKSHQIVIYMDYNEPLPIFTDMTRSVYLDHWAKGCFCPVSIEEEYKLVNRVPDLEGEFGRLDFQETKTRYSIHSLDCELPKDTFDLYYTDEIGNITTSNAYRDSNSVKLIIEPRFPILGGWKTYWKQGYSLPKGHYISQNETDQDRFIAKFYISHPYDDIVAENFILKIILPEGASDVKLDLPFDIDSIQNDLTYRYLDMEGSKVLVIRKKDVIEKYHNLPVTVTYRLTNYYVYFKPALLTFYGICVVAISTLFYKYS